MCNTAKILNPHEAMLALKLTLVPFFLAVISLVGKRYGPSVAGWLAGLPVVVGPILFLLTVENDAAFSAHAAVFTLASVLTVIAFGVSYAWAATKYNVLVSFAAGLLGWLVSAFVVSQIAFTVLTAAIAAFVVLLLATPLYPRVAPITARVALPKSELAIRMIAGAVLTLTVTLIAKSVGETWSGIVALAPVLTPILAVFTHYRNGGNHAIALLKGLVRGLFALATFCWLIALLLETLGIARTFMLSIVAALIVHEATFVIMQFQQQSQTVATSA